MDIIYRYDPHAPLEAENPRTAQEALDRLSSGNARFADIVERMQSAPDDPSSNDEIVIPVTPLSLGVPFASGFMLPQRPYALVLGCSDARAPVEHIFDCGANEVFVVRVAGNVLGLECLGSVDYAVSHLNDSLRTCVVLGHTGCGAVTAAVDMYLAPSEFTKLSIRHPVRSLVDRIMLAVRASSRALNEAGGADVPPDEYRQRLITASVYLNAAVTAFDVHREVSDIAGDAIEIAFGVYNVSRSRVSAMPLRSYDDEAPCFLPAPKSADAFAGLASQVVERLMDTDSNRRTVYL